MIAASTFLLLILCASVGALLLARTLTRRSELAMRTALGAWKGRLFRQFVTETIVLTGVGAAFGLLLAFLALPPLVAFAGQFTSRASEIHVDRTALVFTLTVSVLTALFFGSLITLAVNFEGRGLRGSEPIGGGAMRRPIFKALIVVQIAVSFGLLSGAGLMLRTLDNLARVNTGMSAGDALTMRLSLDFVKYWDADRRAEYFGQVLDRLAETPGIDRVAAAGTVPFVPDGLARDELVPAGLRTAAGENVRPTVGLQVTSGNYFSTVGQTLLEGRSFTAADKRGATNVAVINKTLADRYWPGRSPLGEQLEVPVSASVPTVHSFGTVTVVGVVSDARQRLDQAPIAKVYRPILQDAPVQIHLVVRGSGERDEVVSRVRAALRAFNPQQPIDSVQTLDDARQASLSPTKTTATLLTLFALIALVISAVGIGGVVGSSVSRRTSEFGVMMALGAHRHQVLALVLREGLVLGAAGLVGGLFIAAFFTRSIRGLLFEVDQNDPLTLVAVGLVLLVVTVGACVLPARRAASVDPMRALRCV
jgi:putative ABC transport system permease protein